MGPIALFVKVNGIWCYQGALVPGYTIDEFRRNVLSDIELTKNEPVKTTAYRIVNLDTGESEFGGIAE